MVNEKMDSCLKKGGEARKFAISLESVEYSGDLTNQLMTFSKKMETVYKKLADLISRKVEDPQAYSNFLKVIDDRLSWYEKAEVGHPRDQWG